MIFSRKEPIKDLLIGAVDIHNHILPGIDDGAENIEASINLVKKYKELGFTKIVATPHTMSDYYPNTRESILNALETLNKRIIEDNITGVEIITASEYMIDIEFENMINRGDQLFTYNDNHILVEMSYLGESQNLNEVMYKLQLKDYKPILAHPERYSFYLNDINQYYTLKNKGIKLQLNILSLTGHYGGKIKEVAFKLLKDNMYDYIGVDTHRMEHLEKVENMKVPKKAIKTINQLFENNKSLF